MSLRSRVCRIACGVAALLLSAGSVGLSGASAAPLPVGADGRFGLADVLYCYSQARHLAGAPYDRACDEDEDGRITLGEALLWYGLFTRQAPGITGAGALAVPAGGELELFVTNVPAGDAQVEAQLIVGANRWPMQVALVERGRLVVVVPAEAPVVERGFVRLRRGLWGNRWGVRLGTPGHRVEGGIVLSAGRMESTTYGLRGRVTLTAEAPPRQSETYRLEGRGLVLTK